MKYRLGDICSITKGGIGIMKAIPGPYTMIALGETDKTHIEYQFDTKAVIIPLVSSTGHGHASMKRVKYCEGKFALGNILCAVIPNDEGFVLAKYLHIYLHWNREELLVSQMKGMANVSLPMNRIADVMVTVPSIEKQREIIELEKQLVEKEIEADKLFASQLTQLENLNQAILQEAVQGKLVKQVKKDEPASELLKRIKAEKAKSVKKEKQLPPIKSEEILFEIPENWVWCKLGEITEIKRGKSPKYSDKGVLKMLNQKCVRWYEIDLQYCKSIDEDWFNSISDDFTVKEKDVLVNSTGDGTIGRSAIAHNEVEGYVFDSHVLKITSIISQMYICYYINSNYGQEQVDKSKGATSTKQHELGVNNLSNFAFPLPPISEQKRIVVEVEKQFAKTQQLKEHIIANQQGTEQLLKALLQQVFEVEEIKVAKPKGKVVELQSDIPNWANLVAEPFEKSAANPVNNIQNIDWEMALMVACMKNELGVTYGDVGLQKTVFNTNHVLQIFSKQYEFANSNFGTYCYELSGDLKRNPYLISQKVANNREVYVVNPEYNKPILEKLTSPENKEFVQAIKRMLSIYEHPFINKETDKIELYNTVLKVALDKNTLKIDEIYQGMKDWPIKQAKFKTKAEKFTKENSKSMLNLLIEKGILHDGI